MRPARVPIVLLSLLLIVCVLLAGLFGTEHVSLLKAFSDPNSVDRTILFDVRLPRIALAAIAGAGLAVVGASFQALLRNPLAEPYVLGVSGGSALGATIFMAISSAAISAWSWALVPISALAGGVGATALVYFLARTDGQLSVTSVLLAGVIVNSIASALITFIKTLVSASKAQELLFWLMGFIDVPSLLTLSLVGLYVAAGCAVLLRDSGRMNVLALGDESAQHLGVDVRKLERRVYLASSLVVGAIVSITGLIGFVGLVVPHTIRKLVGPDHRVLLPCSILGGASMLILCDLVARASFQWLGTEPPVGAITALIGGPVFLMLLRKRTDF